MTNIESDPPRRSYVARFFRTLAWLYRIFRNTVLNVLFIFVFLMILALLFVDDDIEPLPENAVLIMNPAGALVEQASSDDFSFDVVFGTSPGRQVEIDDLLDTIERAATDDRIKLVLLDFSRLSGVDFNEAERIQEALLTFKESGKPLWAHGDSYSQRAYMLSAAADQVLMDPLGSIMFQGVSTTTTYYAGLFEKLNIDVDVYHEGEYKTAIEPFIRTDMSDAARESSTYLVDTLWNRVTQHIAMARGLSEERLRAYAATAHELMSPPMADFAELAVEFGFVDALLPRADVEERYQEQIHSDLKEISFSDYLAHDSTDFELSADRIGVVVVQGEILGFESALTGRSSTWEKQIDRVTDDDDYHALVLRVVSPGGSAFESEAIRRALMRYKASGRPLVASFGGVAASGGYWISLPADYIFATPTTITGSIGVFGIYPNFHQAMGEIGVTHDAVRTTPYGLPSDVFLPVTPATHAFRGLQIKQTYDYFVGLVADSRELPTDAVEAIAQGRVWLGLDALGHGLVDEIGELEQAIQKAAELADTSRYRVDFLERESEGFLNEFSRFLQDAKLALAQELTPFDLTTLDVVRQLEFLRDPADIYARCMGCDLSVH